MSEPTLCDLCGKEVDCYGCTGGDAHNALADERLCNVACGLAFDAGMREAERDRAEGYLRNLKGRVWHSGHEACVSGHPEWCKACGTRAMLESEKRDAAVAVERERCAELHGLLLQVAPWIGGIPFHPDTVADVAAAKRRIYEIIESGAPAPREG